MDQVVIYLQDDGVPAVLLPTPDCLRSHSIMEIAVKDVPAGKPFKIVDRSDLPLNISQEAWEIDEAELTDGVGGLSTKFE
jgi:hypothetical protein